METLNSLIRAAYVFFLVYSLIYLGQWLIGMVVSIYRLSRCGEYREHVRHIFSDELARQMPVSIVIPAYNEEACICETVEALLGEDYPNLEIIVVDDGSKDHTAERLIAQYQMRSAPFLYAPQLETKKVREYYRCSLGDKQLILIRKENGGKSDALNCGFNFSRSPYCVVVDADTQVEPGSLRIMACHFLMDKRTIVCAGAVGTQLHMEDTYRELSPMCRLLVLFQHVEYYRTFYMHRLLFDRINANVIVSGAFAMFDRDLVIQSGGYRTNTIGEDMELTMRLHAFCLSQHREYRIAYAPEARCDTQVPFRYRDYFRQRRRWHIGLIQSLRYHLYMIGKHYYGLVGTISVLFTVVYELLAPFIELIGVLLLILSGIQGILDLRAALVIMLIYLVISLLTQSILFSALRTYQIEPMSNRRHLQLILVAASECIIFHPINIVIKITTFFTYRRHKRSWAHIQRANEAEAGGT